MTDRTGSLDPAGPLASTPPAFSHEAADRILRVHYGVTASALTQLAGERDQNFRVEAADGQLLRLKVSNPADELSTVAMQTEALRHIERVDPGLPVMRTLPVGDVAQPHTLPGKGCRTQASRPRSRRTRCQMSRQSWPPCSARST